jgi:ankyrin repeat protein
MLISYLLQLGANPNLGPGIGPGVGDVRKLHLIPNSGRILQSAVRRHSIEALDLLIAHGAVLSNAAVMHAAVEGGSLDMMAHLLKLGADVDEVDNFMTIGYDCYGLPLLRAVHKGKTDVVRFLLENGASIMRSGHSGETALEKVKAHWVKDEIRKMVEEAGAKEGTARSKEKTGDERVDISSSTQEFANPKVD